MISLQKDLELERMLLKWLEMVAGKKPAAESYERWIQDGSVLAKVRRVSFLSFLSRP